MDGHRFKELEREDIKIYLDENWMHMIALVNPLRPGVQLFATILEYKFFPPATEKNADFRLLTSRWPNQVKPPMIWFVISIPSSHLTHAEATAKFCGLNLVKDCFPIMMGEDSPIMMTGNVTVENYENELKDQGFIIFPFHFGVNFYSIENSKDSAIRGDTPYDELIKNEQTMVEQIYKEEGDLPEPDPKEIELWRKYMFDD